MCPLPTKPKSTHAKFAPSTKGVALSTSQLESIFSKMGQAPNATYMKN